MKYSTCSPFLLNNRHRLYRLHLAAVIGILFLQVDIVDAIVIIDVSDVVFICEFSILVLASERLLLLGSVGFGKGPGGYIGIA
jgi:hypothetical protein